MQKFCSFHVIDIDDNSVYCFYTTREVSIFFLGRRLSDHIVVKTDDTGSRVVNFVDRDAVAIENACCVA